MSATPIYDAWKHYLNKNSSPEIFADFGFYFLIAAALQRRVWVGSRGAELYPNIYVVLVGPPGVGKGIVIAPVVSILRSFKKGKTLDEDVIKLLSAHNNAEEILEAVRKQEDVARLVLPTSADTTTYQSLVRDVATAITPVIYHNEQGQKKVYTHCSMYFALKEMGTMFQANQKLLLDFLLDAYDSGDHRYKTKKSGEDCIWRTCVSMLCGTTPSWVADSAMDKIINEGFSSRAFFVFAGENKFNSFNPVCYDLEHIESRKTVVKHVNKLLTVFGEVTFSPEAEEICENYFREQFAIDKGRSDKSLEPYFSRKQVHIKKLCMILHFSEQTELTPITGAIAEKALYILEELEKEMQQAFSFKKRNPLAAPTKTLMKYLKVAKNGLSREEILLGMHGDMGMKELDEVISFLINTKQIIYEKERYKINKV